jgi:hypothetical protein
MPVSVTLGAGRDQLVLPDFALGEGQFGVITVTDFQPGPLGDTVEFLRALSTYLLNWDQSKNPFSSGHLRLVDHDGAAVLQIDRDGPSASHSFKDLIRFTGLSADAFSKEILEGFDHKASLQSLSSWLNLSSQDGPDIASVPPDPQFAMHAYGLARWEHHAFA